MTTLVRPDQPEDDLDALRTRIAEREALLDESAAEADRIERELDMFAARYRQDVGTLHEQLDRLELDIAEAELGELSKAVAAERATTPATPPPSMAPTASAPRFTSDAMRKLFRDVARTIHPDLAGDEHARDRRHALMIQANRAYAMRDEEQLRRILASWERSPEAVEGSDPAATRLRLERRLAQIEEHLDTCGRDLAALQTSRLYELKAMVDDAAAKGQDLVAEMVRRLKRDVMAATNRLDAMRSAR
jgi:septal ring factor EnvC (AmiA/AmiB activator)